MKLTSGRYGRIRLELLEGDYLLHLAPDKALHAEVSGLKPRYDRVHRAYRLPASATTRLERLLTREQRRASDQLVAQAERKLAQARGRSAQQQQPLDGVYRGVQISFFRNAYTVTGLKAARWIQRLERVYGTSRDGERLQVPVAAYAEIAALVAFLRGDKPPAATPVAPAGRHVFKVRYAPALIAALKQLPGWQYHGSGQWSVPNEQAAAVATLLATNTENNKND